MSRTPRHVCLVDVSRPGDNKDYNGGFGTTFDVGKTWRGRLLRWARRSGETLPVITLGYAAAILKGGGYRVTFRTNTADPRADAVILLPSLVRHNEELDLLSRWKKQRAFHTVVAGPLATALPETYLGLADTVVTGEPEAFLRSLPSGEPWPRGRVDSPRLENLDSLPFPDWEIFDHRRFSQSPVLRQRPAAFIQGSRSCPYKCNYCPYIANEAKYQRRSVENVIEELGHLKHRLGVKAVTFRDPVFSMHREWTERLCEAVASADLGLELACETRTDRLDKALLDQMYAAGFRAVKIGVESPDVDVLKKYRRKAPDHLHQEAMVRHAESLGMRVVAFFILGLPDDTRASMEHTLEYALELNASLANFTICTPLPGTEFHEEFRDRIEDHDFNHYDNFHAVFRLDHLSSEEIEDFQEACLVRYYFRWEFIRRHIASWFHA